MMLAFGTINVTARSANILATRASDTCVYDNGTSFATAHVAGLVALYIAANGRATNAAGVCAIRQAIINNSLPQSQWNSAPNTLDPDTNPESLAMPSENWVHKPFLTGASNVLGGFQVGFQAVLGYDYTVQSAPALGAPVVWTNVGSISGAGGLAPASVTDTNAASQAFYRLSRQPSP